MDRDFGVIMDEVEEIKRRIDIVDFISQYLTLKKSGSSYKALCPFHSEKTPSFMVSPEKQIFKCFGCGKSGDVIAFLMEMENFEFPEALRILADKAGVVLKQFERKEYQEIKDIKTKLYEINNLAAKFYHAILKGKPKAQFVRDYLKKREISDESVEKFMLGYAPDSYNMLSNFLKAKGYSMLDVHNAGLAIASEKKPGEYYDRFRDRLMFPISDAMGNVIAFTGRAMHETEAGKYVNSPDTPIFSKSHVIYGLDKAKQAIKEKKQVIIVEGQTDIIAAQQRGFLNVVASSGTALTSFQLEVLGRFTKNLTFAFDQDTAGEGATKRAIDLAHQNGFDVKIMLLPVGQDPDECLRKNPKVWEESLKKQKGAVDYYFDITFANRSEKLEASEKREIAKELLPAIKNLSDKIVQAHYIQKLAELLETPEKFLYEALEKTKTQQVKISKSEAQVKKVEDGVEERLLGLVLAKPELLPQFFKNIKPNDFTRQELKDIAYELKKYYNNNALFNIKSFKKEIPKFATRIDLLVFAYEQISDAEMVKKEFQEYIGRLILSKNDTIKKSYEEKIKEAEKSKDREKVKKLIQEFQRAVIGK